MKRACLRCGFGPGALGGVGGREVAAFGAGVATSGLECPSRRSLSPTRPDPSQAQDDKGVVKLHRFVILDALKDLSGGRRGKRARWERPWPLGWQDKKGGSTANPAKGPSGGARAGVWLNERSQHARRECTPGPPRSEARRGLRSAPSEPSRAGGASAPGRTRIAGTPAPTTTHQEPVEERASGGGAPPPREGRRGRG